MKAIKYTTILAVLAVIFNACTKDVAGPTGPQGLQGPQGATSSYYVAIDSVKPSGWHLNATTGAYNVTIPDSYLTSPNFDIVEVYCSTSYNSLSTWNELPAPNVISTADAMDCSYDLYNVFIQYVFTAAPAQEVYFKVVVITQP